MKYMNNLVEAHIIRFKEDKIEFLLLKRSAKEKYPNIWQMVTGKIKNHEKSWEAALREIKEETNLEINNLFIVPNVNTFYSAEWDSLTSVPVFVAVVNYNSEVEISSEHVEYKWVKKKKAQELLIWPGQEKSVEIIHQFFVKKKKNLNFEKIY